jgi:hypothetical protein
MSDSIQAVGSQAGDVAGGTNLNVGFTLQKTGAAAYSITDTLNVNNNGEKDSGYSIDLSVVQKTLINGGVSGIGSTVVHSDLTASKPSLSLKITDPDAAETGIMVSAKKLKASKSGENYVVDLSGLNKNTDYYYQVYTVDGAGNQLVSRQISSLEIPLAGIIPNSDTADHSDVPALFGLGISAAAIFVLVRRKSLNADKKAHS